MRGRGVKAILSQQSFSYTFSSVMVTSLKRPCRQKRLMALVTSSPGTVMVCPMESPEKPMRT